jgi:hypothetical protein
MADPVCRVARGRRAGWEAVSLENGALRVTILPEKGADIVELTHLSSGVDVLFRAPWELQPPGALPRDGSGELEFLWNYEGGWQELFPSVGGPCVYRGGHMPFHGEVATLPWAYEVVEEGEETVAVRFSVRCRATPFAVERLVRLDAGRETVALDEVVTNEGEAPAHLVWGHHCVVGPPFVGRGCRVHVPARTIETIPELWEDTARLEPGQRSPWPRARLRSGGSVDLSEVPGPDAGSHDDVYLTDLEGGWAEVESPGTGPRSGSISTRRCSAG